MWWYFCFPQKNCYLGITHIQLYITGNSFVPKVVEGEQELISVLHKKKKTG